MKERFAEVSKNVARYRSENFIWIKYYQRLSVLHNYFDGPIFFSDISVR